MKEVKTAECDVANTLMICSIQTLAAIFPEGVVVNTENRVKESLNCVGKHFDEWHVVFVQQDHLLLRVSKQQV